MPKRTRRRKKEYTSNFFQAFSPVLTWFTIRMLILITLINGLSTRQVGFVLVFYHNNIKFDIYMDITQGIETKGRSRATHVLNVLKIVYGKREVTRVWNQPLANGQEEIGFRQFRLDNFVFY